MEDKRLSYGDTVFSLGNFYFSLESNDSELRRSLEQLFLLAQRPVADKVIYCLNLDQPRSISPNWQRHQLDDGSFDFVRLIQMRAMEHHASFLWLDAAVLIKDNPQSKCILISGQSHSGKSTAALAMSSGSGWKILTEDVLLIDTKDDKLIAFPAPQSVRSGTSQRIKDALGIDVPSPKLKNWVPSQDRCVVTDVPARFDVVFHLSVIDPENPGSFECQSLSPFTYVRKILLNSNLIAMDAIDKFADYVMQASCFQIAGGSLSERLNAMIQLMR